MCFVSFGQPDPRHGLNGIGCCICLFLFLFAFGHGRINAVCQLLTRFVPPQTGFGQSEIGIDTDRQRLALVDKPVIHSPIFTHCVDQQIQGASIRVLIPRRCPSVFNVLDKDVGQRHWVYFDGMWVFGSSDTVKSTAFLTVCHVTA